MDAANPWDQYAPFYDWENRRTIGSSDLEFWSRTVAGSRGPILELGCGTGRVSVPLATLGAAIVGVDFSMPMLRRARTRARKAALGSRLRLVRSDIRALPFAPDAFETVIAPYGVVQSMPGAEALAAALRSVARVLAPGGSVWIDLAVEVPRWPEYRNRVRWRQPKDSTRDATLVESVRQDRATRMTIFRQVYTQRRRRGTIKRDFELCFYTPSLSQLRSQLAAAGLAMEPPRDYDGRAWHRRSETLVVRAKKKKGPGLVLRFS
jgi:ubiquinone/menaquinone biosynthesis C-methylase UbiE